jgi:uncharacterized membrane protein YcaP (DUF421 family)
MDLVLRALIILGFVFLVTRAVGKRELSTLEPFDIILLVVIGDLIQQGITQNDESVTGAVIVVSTVALMTVGLSYINLRLPRLRPVLEGEPVILVAHGQPINANMLRERITSEDLLAQARLQSIASLDEVEWAVLETSGQISFLKPPSSGSS